MARSSRRSHHRKRGGGGNSPAWKKSKLVALILVGVIIAALVNMLMQLMGPDKNRSMLPDDFPHTFITPSDAGTDESKIIIERSSRQPKTPFKAENGEWAWPAYYCLNEACPGRGKDGKPYIFPAIDPMAQQIAEGKKPEEFSPDMAPPLMELQCPMCQQAYVRVTDNALKERYVPMNIDKYQTEEGRQMFEELKKRIQEQPH